MNASLTCGGQRYEIAAGQTLTIGRAIESTVRLYEDTAVSRHHCVARIKDGRLIVEDSGSMNGTWVNGSSIDGPTPLHDGDLIQVGGTKLTVHFAKDEPAVHSTSAENPEPHDSL